MAEYAPVSTVKQFYIKFQVWVFLSAIAAFLGSLGFAIWYQLGDEAGQLPL